MDAQAANAGARAFGPGLVVCPDCRHGIDPHGSDPGGPCGVGGCPCLMQPNGIACLLVDECTGAEAERDELRATVARVEAVAARWEASVAGTPYFRSGTRHYLKCLREALEGEA